MSSFLAQQLPAASTVLSDTAVKPFHPPSTQLTSFIPLLEILAKYAYTLLSDNNVAAPTKKSTREKEKTDRDIVLPKKKKISRRKNAGSRKKTSCAKNTSLVFELKPDNKEPNSAKKSSSKVSNLYDKAEAELNVKSMKRTKISKMYSTLISLLYNFSEKADTIMLNLLNILSFVDFETIS